MMISNCFVFFIVTTIFWHGASCGDDSLLYDCLSPNKEIEDNVEPKRGNIYCGLQFNDTEYSAKTKISFLQRQKKTIQGMIYPLLQKHLIELRRGECYTLGEYILYLKDEIDFLSSGNGELGICKQECQPTNHPICLGKLGDRYAKRQDYLHRALHNEQLVKNVIEKDLLEDIPLDGNDQNFGDHQYKVDTITVLEKIRNYRLREIYYINTFAQRQQTYENLQKT